MPRLLDELLRYLSTAGQGVASTRWSGSTKATLQKNGFPDDTPSSRASLSVFEYQGGAPVDRFGSSGPAWVNARVQVVARSTRPAGGYLAASTRAENLAWDAFDALTKVVNQTLSPSTGTYMRIKPVQTPFFLERDDQGRLKYACNYEVARRFTTNA